MALNFATTAHVATGSGSTLDDWAAGTFLSWVRMPDLTASERIYDQGSAGRRHLTRGSGNTSVRVDRTSDLLVTASDSALSAIAANKWVFLAGSFDTAGAASDQHLYAGDLSTPATEATSYTSQTAGTGTPISNASESGKIGNSASNGAPFDGDIAVVQVYNRKLSLAEIQMMQWEMLRRQLSGCVGWWILDEPANTQPDLSGNGNNGTPTNSPTQADGVPLPRKVRTGKPSYTVPVTGVTLTPTGLQVDGSLGVNTLVVSTAIAGLEGTAAVGTPVLGAFFIPAGLSGSALIGDVVGAISGTVFLPWETRVPWTGLQAWDQ